MCDCNQSASATASGAEQSDIDNIQSTLINDPAADHLSSFQADLPDQTELQWRLAGVRSTKTLPWLILAALTCVAQAQTPQAPAILSDPHVHVFPARGVSLPKAAVRADATTSAGLHGMPYDGGPVMAGTVNVYYIWYGNWQGNSAVTILTDFARNIGGSPYFNTNRSYYDGNFNRVANSMRYAGAYYDNYSQGVSDPSIYNVVSNAMLSGNLPTDASGIYVVLTSPDVWIPGFGTAFCGWHSYAQTGPGTYIKYAWIGDGANNSSCSVQTGTSPNDNPPADAMATVIAHELSETVTDPELSAFTGENADYCAWNFGPVKTAPNGSVYNVSFGSRNYLLQQIWVYDAQGYCGLQWPASVPSNQWFNIVSQNSGQCLDVWGASPWPGTQLHQYPCWGGENQKFSFTPTNGGYKITARNSGLQLDIFGYGTGNGAPLIQWPFWGGLNEIFGVSQPDSQGYVDVTAFHSGRVLDVDGMSSAAGTIVQQWDYWNGPNQKWRLVPVQ